MLAGQKKQTCGRGRRKAKRPHVIRGDRQIIMETSYTVKSGIDPAVVTWVNEADKALGELAAAATMLHNATAADITAQKELRDVQKALKTAEHEMIIEAEDEGLLPGAKTSKVYAMRCEALVADNHRDGGALHAEAQIVAEADSAALQTEIEIEQARTAYSAARHATELHTAILRALAN